MLGEGDHDKNDLDGDFIDSFADQGWQKECHKWNLEVATHQASQVKQRVWNLKQSLQYKSAKK